MLMKNDLGTKIKVLLVDPWDFVTMNGSGPFIADVVQDEPAALLLEFHVPLKYNGEEFKYFIATTRQESVRFEALGTGKAIACNLTGIPEARAMSANPFDLSSWRGGAAAIADLSLHT
jgi:hypothetical protein